MTALSDHLPALSSHSARSLWLPEQLTARVHDATSSMAVSYNGEAFLDASAAQILVHLGPAGAERAINFVHARPGSQALLFHPSPYVRAEQRSYLEAIPGITILGSLSELEAFKNKLVNVYIDESCFDLAMVEEIAAHTTIDWLIGAFESLRYPTGGIYPRLKSLARHFRLRDASLHTLIHAGPADAIDISLILPAANADSLLALEDEPTAFTVELVLAATDLNQETRSRLESRASERLKIVIAEAPTTAEALAKAVPLASGRYLGFGMLAHHLSLPLTARLFEAAIIGNADLAVLGTAQGKEHLVVDVQRSAAESLCTEPLVRPALFRRSFLEFHNLEPDLGNAESAAPALLAETLLLNPEVVRVRRKGEEPSHRPMSGNELATTAAAVSRRALQLGTRFCDDCCLRLILSSLLASRPDPGDAAFSAYDNEASSILQSLPDRISDGGSLIEDLPESLRLYAQALLTEPGKKASADEQVEA
ncbi:hypothetical protein [Devosia sp. 1566]|uniref:hypothetical protein n=1 Tax=Devosia sp. 1566 TaxID=2499144 RepID=UPI000FD948F6|nr:hypothetical protein [Devosia sp. 1566]